MSDADEVARLRQERTLRLRHAKEDILFYLETHAEGYSREFRDSGVDLDVQTISKLLRELTDSGFLEARVALPPHADLPGNMGFARTYYRRKSRVHE